MDEKNIVFTIWLLSLVVKVDIRLRARVYWLKMEHVVLHFPRLLPSFRLGLQTDRYAVFHFVRCNVK